ncbi:MAG: bifunctional phosphoribosylaminoimidazolecarboxamide formyltransferase/IMP cyclohydrolase [Wenzhouxiangella sp.]|nr:bifunctional phosphoribosylaminoimidazolecarboxamide formyltransferase/IMP cyclohydrolase [Wenzhouxiangella sp.]MCH8476407.1 bifunctional phosphoribosylaminoimidazolecarboxamide formyltransferase/IMP cyclohydrolase [Wenzhouxiangella sp.]
MNSATAPVALLSVSDKTGIVELGRALAAAGWTLLSTGGTALTLRDAGLNVIEVSDHTGFPEIMGGRVKTLHPTIHGGILARRGRDEAVLAAHGITAIDLVVVNLYPFSQTVARPDCSLIDAIEQIDIGGPAMVRAAAKNHAAVSILCDPADYQTLIEQLPAPPTAEQRRALAVKAFAHTAAYDGQVSQYLAGTLGQEPLPAVININLDRVESLRYGENPHQGAGLYRQRNQPATGLAGARLVQGKPLSYNNLLDADAALTGIRLLGPEPGCVIIKHSNPCGAATGSDLAQAWHKALACDPTSAFGGIVAFNGEIDADLAEMLTGRFLEVIVATGVSAEARAILSAKPNLRVLVPGSSGGNSLSVRAIDGGWLVQQADDMANNEAEFKVVTRRHPTEREMTDLRFAWAVVKMVRSNAIVYARDGATLGIGAGQMSRVDSARIGALKAEDAGLSLEGAAMASDAFFPFADGIETAAGRGIRAVIQPGGSMRDAEVIDACDAHDIAMVVTGRRHFRH